MKTISPTLFLMPLLCLLFTGCVNFKPSEFEKESRFYKNYKENFMVYIPEGYELVKPDTINTGGLRIVEQTYYDYDDNEQKTIEYDYNYYEGETKLINKDKNIVLSIQPLYATRIHGEEAKNFGREMLSQIGKVKEVNNCLYTMYRRENSFEAIGFTYRDGDKTGVNTIKVQFKLASPKGLASKAMSDFQQMMVNFHMPCFEENERYSEN